MEKKDMWCCSLKVPIVIFAKGLQDDGDDCHDGFDNAELESRLENTLQFRMRHPKKKKSRTPWRRRRMRDDEGRQNLFVHSHCSLTVSLNHFHLWSFLIITITAILMWKWTHEHRIHTIVKTCRCSEQIANLTYESLLHDSSWYKHLYTLFIQTLVRLSCILL